jgi:hypothetical protein
MFTQKARAKSKVAKQKAKWKGHKTGVVNRSIYLSPNKTKDTGEQG